jgi:flagellin-like hook-associated protein FlgL
LSDIRLSRATSSVLLGLQGITDLQGRNALRLGSGLKVSSPLDNAPAYFMAAGMRGEVDDLGSVKQGITLAQTDVSLATTRAQSILKLLGQMQALVKTLPSIQDQTQLHGIVDGLHVLAQQIDGLSNTAEPDSINLLTGDTLTVGLDGKGKTADLGLDIGLTVKSLGLGFLLDQPDTSDVAVPVVTAPANSVPSSVSDANRALFNPSSAAAAARASPPIAGQSFTPLVVVAPHAATVVGTGVASGAGLAGVPTAGSGAALPMPSGDVGDEPDFAAGSSNLPTPMAGNGVDTGSVQSAVFVPAGTTASQNQAVKEVVYGTKWGAGAIGTPVTITYSFHNASSTYAAPGSYSGAPEAPYDNPVDLNASMVTAVQRALQNWANVADLTFVQVADTATSAGDIRFGISDAPATSYAFTPSGSATGGDVWFGTSGGGGGDYRTADATNTADYTYFFDTAMHEIGHALGFKHPHDADVNGANNFGGGPLDSIQYSIMSYRDYIGEPITGYRSVDSSGNSYLPATPQIADIAALQYLYGTNTSYQTGANTYVFTEGQHVYQTIWDNGANDTIDISGVTSSANLNLTPGTLSDVGAAPVVDVLNLANVLNQDNLGIAYGVNVKNAVLGSGNDTVTCNDVGDNITCGSGNDTVTGGGGNDTVSVGTGTDVLDGGGGSNTAIFAGNMSQYSFAYTGQGNDIQVTGPDGRKTLSNFQFAQFADVTAAIPTDLSISGTPGGGTPPSILYIPSVALLQSAVVRAQSVIASLGAQQDQLTSRSDFTDGRVNILKTGIDKLTLADLDEEGAASAAELTRQQMSMVALSIVSRQASGLLAMFH